MSDDIVEVLDGFLQAYPEDIFPTPPPERQAKDAAAAHVLRVTALPWMQQARDEIVRLRALCISHEVDPEGCIECFMADVEHREPAPLPHGIDE